MRRLAWMPLFALLAAAPSHAQTSSPSDSSSSPPPLPYSQIVQTPPDYPRGRISSLLFGDLYWNAVGDPRHFYDARGADQGQVNIDGKKNITRDLNGAQIRRVYFQLDNDLTARVATRFRLEVDGKELTSGGKLGVFLKNGYLQAKSVFPRADFLFGEINTPTFDNAEAFWQYRAVEKTVGDFWGLRPSSDLGLELKGYLDGDHRFGYAAMVGDGTGQKPETDRFKTVYFAVPLHLGDLRLEPYVDYQPVRVDAGRLAVSDTVANNDQATYHLFAGYEFRRFAVGAEAYDRVLHGGARANVEPRAGSLFVRGMVAGPLSAYARVDQYAPDHHAPNRVDVRLWIAGLDWQPIRDLHVLPNIEETQYLSRGTAVGPPHHDLQARITFLYLVSRPQS